MAGPGSNPRESPPTGEPGEPGDGAARGRRLAEAPSARYTAPAPSVEASGPGRASLRGPFTRAVVVALAGAVGLVLVGAILASTFGLLFVAGITGGTVGLVLSRAAAPRDETLAPTARRTIAWLAIGLSLTAVVLAAAATWLVARQEGGTLGLVDYLLMTFGPFVPAEAIIAGVAAWWGATSGPIQA